MTKTPKKSKVQADNHLSPKDVGSVAIATHSALSASQKAPHLQPRVSGDVVDGSQHGPDLPDNHWRWIQVQPVSGSTHLQCHKTETWSWTHCYQQVWHPQVCHHQHLYHPCGTANALKGPNTEGKKAKNGKKDDDEGAEEEKDESEDIKAARNWKGKGKKTKKKNKDE